MATELRAACALAVFLLGLGMVMLAIDVHPGATRWPLDAVWYPR